MPPTLQGLGLAAAVGDFLNTIPSEEGWETDLQVSGEVRRLPAKTELAAFRIVQEAVNNTLRHAGPCRIRVRLDFGSTVLDLTVADNGRGFDRDQVAGGGLGLRSLESRSFLAGGTFSLESQPGSGTTIKIHFPNV